MTKFRNTELNIGKMLAMAAFFFLQKSEMMMMYTERQKKLITF